MAHIFTQMLIISVGISENNWQDAIKNSAPAMDNWLLILFCIQVNLDEGVEENVTFLFFIGSDTHNQFEMVFGKVH